MEHSSQKRVLLVDDNPIDLMIHGKILEKAGLTDVDFVGSGQQALQYLDDCVQTGSYPDLLLLDVNMPVMDGLEFLDRYCGKRSYQSHSMQVVLLTSSLDPKDRQRAAAYGVNNYLEKPLRVDNLLKVLREKSVLVRSEQQH